MSLCALVLSVSAVSASALDKVTVQSSRGLRVAVIDNSNQFSARASVREALEVSFSASLTGVCKTNMPVRIKLAEGTRAVADLLRGSYDGVVVIGNSVSPDLLMGGVIVLKANNAKTSDLNQTFYLLSRDEDVALQLAMGTAFDQAIESAGFQRALKGDVVPVASVASASR